MCTHMYTSTWRVVCAHACVCTRVCMHPQGALCVSCVCTCVYTSTGCVCACVCTCTHGNKRPRACVPMSLCVYIHVLCVYIHMVCMCTRVPSTRGVVGIRACAHMCMHPHGVSCVRAHVGTLLNSHSWTLDTHCWRAPSRRESQRRVAGGGRRVLAERGPLFLSPRSEPGVSLSSVRQPGAPGASDRQAGAQPH